MSYDNFDIADALYTFAAENHAGSGTYLYSLLSKLQRAPIAYKPGPSVCSGELSDEADMLLSKLQKGIENPESLFLELEHGLGLLTDEEFNAQCEYMCEEADREARADR